MTLFQETTAAGERGAGAPGGAQRHLPPPAAPAALAPPRERPRRHQCAVCGRRGTKERLFGPQLGWGDSLPSESLPLRGLPSDRCSALPRCNRARPGAARVAPPGGRGTQSGPWFPRILGLRPRLKTLSVPSDFGDQRGYLGGAKILGQPPLISQCAAYRAISARPWEPTLQAAYRIRGERRH